MRHYGVDLAEWYAAGRWEALLDFIDHLPAASLLREASANDPRVAEIQAQLPSSGEEWTPPVSEFGTLEQILTGIGNELKMLTAVTMAANGNKNHKMKPFPHPKTELDRLRERQEKEALREAFGSFGFHDVL